MWNESVTWFSAEGKQHTGTRNRIRRTIYCFSRRVHQVPDCVPPTMLASRNPKGYRVVSLGRGWENVQYWVSDRVIRGREQSVFDENPSCVGKRSEVGNGAKEEEEVTRKH